jgi:hypothetical protein
MAHVGRRQELALLDVDDAAGARRRLDEIGLARQEGRDLQDVGDLGDRADLGGLVDVGEDRHAGGLAHAARARGGLRRGRGRGTSGRTCGSPCRRTP